MEPTPPIRVVIVEDHAMVAEGLAAALNEEPDFGVVDVALTLSAGLTLIEEQQPDVALMDYRLPDGDGAQGATEISRRSPTTSVLIVTSEPTDDRVAAALETGCSGVLRKGQGVAEVADAIRAAHAGETVFSSSMLAQAARHLGRSRAVAYDLTEREREVLELLSQGASTARMAEQLGVSLHTVRNHVRNLTAKLGARSRLEAVAIALEAGLVARKA